MSDTIFGLFFGLQVILLPSKERTWGTIFDAVSLQPVALAAVSIFDAQSNKLLKTRLSDYYGRFNFLAPPGDYQLMVSKPNYVFPPATKPSAVRYKHLYMGGTLSLKKENSLIKADIPLQRKTMNGDSD